MVFANQTTTLHIYHQIVVRFVVKMNIKYNPKITRNSLMKEIKNIKILFTAIMVQQYGVFNSLVPIVMNAYYLLSFLHQALSQGKWLGDIEFLTVFLQILTGNYFKFWLLLSLVIFQLCESKIENELLRKDHQEKHNNRK